MVSLDWLVATLHAVLDTVTEADTCPLSRALHVAHMLVPRQGADGRWSTAYNACTGEEIGEERSFALVPLFRRMNAMLGTTEFDSSCSRAEAGGYPPADEKE